MVDWVFYNVSGGEYIIGHGVGGAHAQHNYCDPISWEEALPGDLVFTRRIPMWASWAAGTKTANY